MSVDLPIGVLASGHGTNLQALIDAGLPVGVVLSNVADAGALARARRAGIPALAIPHNDFATRAAFEDALLAALATHGARFVVLAGFMRLLTPHFLERFPDRVINVHPALLPAFPGVDAQRQALDHGVRVTGVTVHFVDAGTDTGPIILQEPLAIDDAWSLDDLRERLHLIEHRLLPRAVALLVEGRLRRDGRRVRIL